MSESKDRLACSGESAGSVKDLVKGAAMGVLRMAGVPQGGSHGATTTREEGASE
jgi:hypothetical protein